MAEHFVFWFPTYWLRVSSRNPPFLVCKVVLIFALVNDTIFIRLLNRYELALLPTR